MQRVTTLPASPRYGAITPRRLGVELDTPTGLVHTPKALATQSGLEGSNIRRREGRQRIHAVLGKQGRSGSRRTNNNRLRTSGKLQKTWHCLIHEGRARNEDVVTGGKNILCGSVWQISVQHVALKDEELRCGGKGRSSEGEMPNNSDALAGNLSRPGVKKVLPVIVK